MTEQNSNTEKLVEEIDKLYTVLEATTMLSSTLNLNTVLDTLMSKAKEVMKSEASSLMLFDEESQELYFHTLTGDKSEILKSIRLKLGEGISGWVAEQCEPVLVEDCSKDERFSKKADNLSHFVTRSMMCVPLQFKNRVLGTVQVLNKLDGSFFNNKDLRIFQVLANQAATAVENARLHEMATVDGMTRLYVKSYFLARLKEEFRRAKNSGQPLSLLMTDIDFFKKVNDNFGHQGGDLALIELAGVMNDTVTTIGGDLMTGRYGGEEFCVLMPNVSPEQGLEYGEMIRKNIESRPIPIEDKTANITISIGVSSYPLHEKYIEESEDFVKYADEALYICKRKGRNCVTIYTEDDPAADIPLEDGR